jgi:superfamily II DNA or RNA helicase
VRAQLTFVPSELVPAGGTLALWSLDTEVTVEQLAEAATALAFPVGEPVTLPTIADDTTRVAPREAPARALPLLPAVRRLAALPPGSDLPAWSRPAPSVLAWSVAAKLALELVAAGRLLPGLEPTGTPGEGRASWRAVAPSDTRPDQLAAALPVAAYALRHPGGALWSPEDLVRAFLDAVADACAREGRRPELDPRRRGPRRPWAEMWADALSGSDPTVPHLRVAAEDLASDLADWAAPLIGTTRGAQARLALRLTPPEPADAASSAGAPLGGRWHLDFLLRATEGDVSIPVDAVWQQPGGLELDGRRIRDPEVVVVRGLAAAARLFPPLDRALSETRPSRIELAGDEVAVLLADGIDALTAAGIEVEVPPELRDAESRRLRVRVRIGQSTPMAPRVEDAAPLGLASLTDLRYELALGDDTISVEEFARIVALQQPLVRWRGAWVRVDAQDVDRMAELAGTSASLDLTEALAAALSGQHLVDDLGWVDAVADGAVGDVVARLRGASAPGEATIVGIDGELRAYQERGVAWLQRLADLGIGGVLADEMGLGKTLQAIALLAARSQDRPHLVVCPTSVVGNWERELVRFAPGLPVVRHHGPDRAVTRRAFRAGQVVVTSYALLRRDIGVLEDVEWDVVVFDEAQQVKNPASKGARAARSLTARTRVAMTGTPIENRLSELWAIVDLTNPGLLGSQRRFNERFAVPVERWHDADAAARLRRLVAPFVLRRRKGDPDVAVALPPKQEITVACSLTREQASLYQAAVDEAFRGEGLGSTAFERRGRILALLTALKQICNHPAQYLRDGSSLRSRSGKLSRATEILAELVDAGERALVFTQFREMGHLLGQHLGSQLALEELPFLHGGVPLGARDDMVRRFQEDEDAPPVLLVSLRAGGTGLNLTRANHVVHFDRWWNPAVEDQATDRVHRIGQTSPVTVHTLVTAGTIEERIAELLDRKRGLADAVVGSGESWLTELDDDALRDLLALSTDDLEDEDDEAPMEEPEGRPRLVALPGGRT